MKTSALFRALLPLAGLVMTSCETNGQLLPVDLTGGLAAGAVAVGTVVSIVSNFRKKNLAF